MFHDDQTTSASSSMPRASGSSNAHRKVIVAAACTLPADSLFAILLYLVYPDSFLPSTLFIANFSLVLLALIGINLRISSIILPALIWKSVLLLFLLFLGCISVDGYQQIPVDDEFPAKLEFVHTTKSIVIWKDLANKYPLLPLIAVICTIVLAIEARIFFTAWQQLCCSSMSANGGSSSQCDDIEKAPPSYVSCVRETSTNPSSSELPTYEDAVRKANERKSVYTLPDVHLKQQSVNVV